MAYFSQERKSQIAPQVKAILKKYNLRGSIRVRNHSTVVLTLASGPIDFIGNNLVTMGRSWAERRPNITVNPYHFRNHFDGEAREALTELFAALNEGNYDRSQAEYDYFDRGWYVDVEVGRWNRGYTVTA
jgi:hypothetical protein